MAHKLLILIYYLLEECLTYLQLIIKEKEKKKQFKSQEERQCLIKNYFNFNFFLSFLILMN